LTTHQELKKYLSKVLGRKVPPKEAEAILKNLDSDKNGSINYQELLQVWRHQQSRTTSGMETSTVKNYFRCKHKLPGTASGMNRGMNEGRDQVWTIESQICGNISMTDILELIAINVKQIWSLALVGELHCRKPLVLCLTKCIVPE
jgi:hypothetical protein